ncbi:MAG TPA: tetratricopeptide repeat protein [Candidatus Binatia bacterium]|jgi:hypothetical protein
MRARHALHLGVIALAVIVAYAASVHGEWISDDITSIAQNPALRSLAPGNILAIMSRFEGPNYAPLYMLSYAIDWAMFGNDPTGFHVVNVLFHIADAALVYLLLLRLGERAALAFGVALVWAVHPVHVESVAWISERKNVLSTLLFLLAVIAYVRYSDHPRPRTYAAIFVLYVCGMLVKINVIVLPAVMLAYEVVYRTRLRRRDVLATLPLLAIAAFLAWVNLHGNPSHGAHYHGGSLWVTLRTSASVIPRYLRLVVAPIGLSSYYATPLRASWLDLDVLGAMIVIVGLLGAACVLAWRHHPSAFWILWFFVTLSPMLNLVPFPAIMADRYLYIPLVGPLVLIAWGIDTAVRRAPALGRAVPAAVGAAALACVALTIQRVPAFHDELALWADWALHTAYITSDRPYGPAPRPRELQLLRDALAKDDGSGVLHNNLGGIAFEEGRMPEALAELSRAYQLAPRDPAIALNLGRTYLYSRQPEAAARVLEEAVRLEPPSYYANLNLARAYILSGDALRASDALARARAIRPDWSDLSQVEDALARLERR